LCPIAFDKLCPKLEINPSKLGLLKSKNADSTSLLKKVGHDLKISSKISGASTGFLITSPRLHEGQQFF